MTASTEPLLHAPVLVPVATVPATFQGHGPACRWHRHTQIDGRFAISTIGRPHLAGALPRAFETRAFRMTANGYRTIPGVVYSTTQLAARQVHRHLVHTTVAMIQGHEAKALLGGDGVNVLFA